MYYPRSFLKFILLSFLLVSLPLVYALAQLAFSLDRLASQGREELLQASQAARQSRVLFDQATTLERIVRQQLILDDPALIDDYNRVRGVFLDTAGELARSPLDAAERRSLARIVEREAALAAELAAPGRGREGALVLARGYAELVDGAQAMFDASHQLTQRAIERLQETADGAREQWRWLALATAGIAIVLAVLFAVLIARPIRQLDQAIRQMGSADFEHAIVVDGPQDMRYLGQRLEWLRTRLKDLEQQQTRFLRHVSHELKTPLTAVREGAELLRDQVGGRLTREQHDIVRIVRENTLSLQRLIEDLLRWHQARAVEPATLGPVALPEVVRRVLREQTLASLARMVVFDTRLDPLVVTGDGERLRTVVDNLVSNAIKYSPRSGRIGVTLAARDGAAVLEVTDDGPGVPVADRERVFETFFQGNAPAEGRIKGSGLGLAIAREYAMAHGGRIEVVDRPDGARGARFRLVLPLVLATAADSPSRGLTAAGVE